MVLQATVYDDLHMGDFIAVVVNFTNQKTEHAEGGVRSNVAHCCTWCPYLVPNMLLLMLQDLHACTWMSAHQITKHPHGDALLVW